MKILYLYAELMGYQIPVFKEYVNSYGAVVHVVHWDSRKLTPYTPPAVENVHYYERSKFNRAALLELAERIKPDIVYVSGWMDKIYLSVCRKLVDRGVPVVAGCDTQWKGSLKQIIGSYYFRCCLRRCFSYIWVAGPYQYEYARKLGFDKRKIIFNTLSADTDLFTIDNRGERNNTNAFLYVGNFKQIKGTDILIRAFNRYRSKYEGDWKLICVGNGELRHILDEQQDVIVYEFKSQSDLIEISKKASVFILPSKFDQWGLVVHEFSSLGFPLILSDTVGASPVFLIDGFNGYTFESGNADELADVMHKMASLSIDGLTSMSQNSEQLGKRISPKIAAASFMSALT